MSISKIASFIWLALIILPRDQSNSFMFGPLKFGCFLFCSVILTCHRLLKGHHYLSSSKFHFQLSWLFEILKQIVFIKNLLIKHGRFIDSPFTLKIKGKKIDTQAACWITYAESFSSCFSPTERYDNILNKLWSNSWPKHPCSLDSYILFMCKREIDSLITHEPKFTRCVLTGNTLKCCDRSAIVR